MARIRTYATHFCGVGGACAGLHAAGLECKLAIDNWAPAVEWRERNLGHKALHMDIVDYEPDDSHAADLLWTSPPCQTFSSARETNYDKEDRRNYLYLNSVMYAEVFKPRFVVIENVQGLLNHDFGATLDGFKKAFGRLGYNFEWNILNAVKFGVPQSRPRLFMVCSREGDRGLIPAHPRLDKQPSFGDIMEHQKEELGWGGSTYGTALRKKDRTGVTFKIVESSGKDERGRPLDIMPTITCGFNGGPTRKKTAVLDHTRSRLAFLRDPSVREGARAQGFPDEWEWPENTSDAWTLIGNAVAVPVAKAIGKHLIALSEGRKPRAKIRHHPDEVRSACAVAEGNMSAPDLGFEEE